MTAAEVPEMSLRIRSVQLVKSLLTLTDYLIRIRELEKRKPIFMWDFEMLKEAMRPADASSVYSGILWFGLESLRETAISDQQWRIVLPEGTRTELKNELKIIRERYKSILDRPEPHIRLFRETADSGLQQFDIAGYKEIVPYVERLGRLDQTMAYLLLLLRSYARPMPLASHEIPTAASEYYLHGLNRRRQDRAEQNEADALNLASADVLGEMDTEEEFAPLLVSATNSVLNSNGKTARDPMFFALTALVLKEFPDWKTRERNLRKMISRLFNIISAIEEQVPGAREMNFSADVEIDLDQLRIEDPDDRVDVNVIRRELDIAPSKRAAMAARTPRQDVDHFTAAVDHLRKDGVLVQLAELLSQATQAVKNARFQSRAIADDIQLLRQTTGGGGVLDLIDHLVEAFEGTSEKPLKDVAWRRRDDGRAGKMFDFSNGSGHVFLEGERLSSGIAIAWKSFDSLGEFSTEAIKLCHDMGLHGPVQMLVRFPNRADAITHEVSSLVSLREVIRDLTDTKLALLRLDFETMRLWFDPGDIYFNTQNPSAWRQTRLAAHIYDNDLHAAMANFVARTSASSLNGPTVEGACRDLWKFPIKERAN